MRKLALLLALMAWFTSTACGGGGGGGGGRKVLSGTAAGGAAISAGQVFVSDRAGTRRSVPVAADGRYELDVTGLTGPYLIQVVGMLGGRPAVLHSVALAEEVGKKAINVTPLTELVCAMVLQQDLQDIFNQTVPDLSRVTAGSLQGAEAALGGKLASLYSAFGVTGQSPRTTPFSTDGTGMDGLLDATNVLPVQDPSTRALRYELRVVTREEAVVLDPANLSGSPEVPFTEEDRLALADLGSAVGEINARLQELSSLFATALPTPAEVTSFFSTDFLHGGLTLDAHLAQVLLQAGWVGHRVSRVAVERRIGPDELQVSYAVTFAEPSFPRAMFTTMRRVAGRWSIAGDRQLAATDVTFMARVFSKRLTEAEVAARSDVITRKEWNQSTSAEADAYYLKVPDSSAADGHHLARIGFPGEENFGVLALAGNAFDQPSTADLDERDLQRRFSRFLGTANGRVRAYMIFRVSSVEVDSRVHHVVVTGPGLPDAGLILTRPRPDVWRDHFILKDDFMDWNSFNTERCQNFSAPAGCALDWSRIVTGSTYRYSFRSEADVELGVQSRRLLGRPLSEEGWLAARERFFPMLQLTGAQEFNLANLLDPTPGAPYTTSGTTTIKWRTPSDPIVRMQSLLVWRNYQLDDLWGVERERKESHVFSLVGSESTSRTVTFDPVPFRTVWGWATIVARDVYGNELNQEVSPQNPWGDRCVPTAAAPICDGAGYHLPPRVKAPRSYPRLANYFHMMHYPEAQVANREDYLAQWDVIVLNPQFVKDVGVSIARIREVNPGIKILAWIPIGQSSLDFEMSTSMPGLPLDQGGEYFLRGTDGAIAQWWWGGYFMNPFKNDFAFPRQVVSYLKAHYLVPGMYDGAMFDCLFYNPPTWLAGVGDLQVNGITADDGVWFDHTTYYDWGSVTERTTRDNLDYRAGNTYLLQSMASEVPAAIVTGNGIGPWNTAHLPWAHGSLVESAYGDEFGSGWATWAVQWDEYRRLSAWLGRSPKHVMVNADVRHGRTDPEAREVPGMTTEDLRRFRLSLTTTLLDDGYFAFDRGDGNHAQLWWFPEYEIDLGNPAPGYVAPPVRDGPDTAHTYRTDVYATGTYSREFDNGTVVVNPGGEPRTVAFDAERTDVSTGGRATSFTIPPRDGRIFMK